MFHIDHASSKSFLQIIHFHVNEDDDKLTYSSSHSLAPKELRSLRDFFLGQKDKGKIILFGGFSDSLISEGFNARQPDVLRILKKVYLKLQNYINYKVQMCSYFLIAQSLGKTENPT